MKEKLKYFLLGACSVVGGFLLYAWTRNTSEPGHVMRENRAASAPDPAASTSNTGAYVSRRREQMQKQKAAQACDTVHPGTADASSPDANALTSVTSDHAATDTDSKDNNK